MFCIEGNHKKMLKKFIAHSLIFSLVFNNFAFATQPIIELDFKDSQTP